MSTSPSPSGTSVRSGGGRALDVDALRGLAALCVILGHAVQRAYLDSYLAHPVFKSIYMFHMPLFVMLSGYTTGLGRPSTPRGFAEKAARLLWPTLVWSLLVWGLRDAWFVGIRGLLAFPGSLGAYLRLLATHPNFVIWFLYVILACTGIVQLAERRGGRWFWPVVLTVGIAAQHFGRDLLGIPQIGQFLPFFVGGFLLGRRRLPVTGLGRSLALPAALLLVLGWSQWSYYAGDKATYYLLSLSLCLLVNLAVNSDTFRQRLAPLHRALAFLGPLSLELYLAQCVVLNLGIGSGALRAATVSASALAFSLAVAWLARRNRFLNLFLFGRSLPR